MCASRISKTQAGLATVVRCTFYVHAESEKHQLSGSGLLEVSEVEVQ